MSLTRESLTLNEDESTGLCVVCHKRKIVADGLCGPCWRWEEG